MAVSQIEKDLLRTMPSNACFSNMNSIGVPRLRRILRGLAWLYPEIGYCQGTGMVTCFQSLYDRDCFVCGGCAGASDLRQCYQTLWPPDELKGNPFHLERFF